MENKEATGEKEGGEVEDETTQSRTVSHVYSVTETVRTKVQFLIKI